MWTLVGKRDDKKRKDAKDHSFLILSKEDSALILKTEEEISELEESGFNTASKTVFAGNIGNNRFIVQVSIIHKILTCSVIANSPRDCFLPLKQLVYILTNF